MGGEERAVGVTLTAFPQWRSWARVASSAVTGRGVGSSSACVVQMSRRHREVKSFVRGPQPLGVEPRLEPKPVCTEKLRVRQGFWGTCRGSGVPARFRGNPGTGHVGPGGDLRGPQKAHSVMDPAG